MTLDRMNMYGCTPCPECNEPYRCVCADKPRVMQCHDGGLDEPITAENYDYFSEDDDV